MDIVNIGDRIIKYAFLTLFLLTPVLFNPSRIFPSFELFEWNKMIFVYLITIIVTTFWIVKMIVFKKLIFKRTPLFWPLIFFLAVQIIATVFSVDPHVSIWGYYSRFHGGLLSTIAYITLYFAFVSNLSYLNLRQFLFLLLTSGALVSLYGVGQRLGIDKDKWVQDVQSRVFSTLGQPNWLAAYLDILLLMGLGLLTSLNFQQHNEKFSTKESKKFFLLLSFFILIFYLCLLFTKSRSGFLGFWGANAVFWILAFFASKGRKRVRIISKFPKVNFSLPLNTKLIKLCIILNCLFLLINFFVKTPFPQYNRWTTVEIFHKQEKIEPVQAPIGDSVINVGITDSAKIRQIVWSGAVEIIKNYPLFGTGPETFAFAYYRFRPSAHNLTSEWDFLYNRAHNEFLNIAATSGLIGLATYLLLITVIFIELLKRLKHFYVNNLVVSAVISSYISILITNFFGFSVVMIGIFFFLLPVIWDINFVSKNISSTFSFSPWTSLPLVRKIGVIIAILVGFTGIGYISKIWVADSMYAQALSYFRADQLDKAYPKILTATKLRPDEPNFHDARADIAVNYASFLTTRDATTSAQLFQDAVSESNVALTISPQNVNFWKTRTRVLFALSEVEPAFLNNALGAIQLAMELAPTDPKLTYNTAVIYGRLNRAEDAIKSLHKTIELKPDYRDAYIALSIFYIEQKNFVKAREILELALERINPEDEEIKQRLTEIKF